jgi:hypothetical protein
VRVNYGELPHRTEGALLSSTKSRKTTVYTVPHRVSSAVIRNAASKAVIRTLPLSLADVVLEGIQTTISQNHPEWLALERAVRTGRPSPLPAGRDWGGDFTMLRTWIESPEPAIYKTRSASFFSSTDGVNVIVEKSFPLYVPIVYNDAVFPPFARSSDATLQAVGTVAISRCSPANSVANLAVATLDTFKDGLPHLLGHSFWEDRTRLARNAGDEYLNVEFGWNPLVNDVKSFAQGVAEMGDLQSQFFRDSGKDIRRRYSFPTQVTTVDTSLTAPGRVAGGPFDLMVLDQNVAGQRNGAVVRSRRTTVDRWFSGAFTYHAPPEFFGSTGEHLAHASHILGLELNPEVLWQLAPWSWAADWFSNAGDVVNNLNNYSVNGQVLRRGYIMEHTVVRDVYSYVGDVGFDPVKVNFAGHPVSFVVCSETKIRRRATPFGFGVSLSSISPAQIAIMAALGLTFLA